MLNQQSAFSPLTEKCFYWTNLLKAYVTSVGERSSQFVDVLDQIFCSNYLFTSSRSNEADYNALRNFLSPNGPLFSTIDRLLMENNTKFDVHVYKLNSLSQQKLRSPDVSEFFRRIYDINRGIIHTNAFEYFFYRFADNVYQRPVQDETSLFDGLLDCAYSVLLQDYLFHFLPIDRSLAPYLDDSVANRSDFCNVSTVQQRPIGLGLLKREIYEKAVVTPNEQNVAMTAPSSAFLAKSWTLLQILCDLWVTNGQSTRADGFLTMLIRSIVKHVHRFAWRTSMANGVAQLGAFNENVVSRLFAPRLLKFFEFNFAKWPLDASFRSLLELWLTFIQPWRYSDVDEHQDSMVVDERWEIFIDKHYVFYAKFLRCTFTRLIRTDLKAFKNAFSLFRVVRVFGQPNLMPMLKYVSQSRSNTDHRNNSYSGNVDCFLDSSEFQTILYQLANEIQSAYAYCLSNLHRLEQSSQNRSFTDRLIDFFSDSETETVRLVDEFRKTSEYLDYSLNALSQLFDLPNLKDNVINHGESSPVKRQLSTSSSSSTVFSKSFNEPDSGLVKPDYIKDQNGYLKLSPRGRNQIMNKLCSFNYNYVDSAPFDLAPPRFDEISALVSFWRYIDGAINRQYGKNIERLYNRPDFLGRFMASYAFCPPTSDFYKRSPVSSRARVDLPARLSLRYFARVRFCIMYTLLIFIFWLIFSVNPISIILFSIFLLVLFVIFIANM